MDFKSQFESVFLDLGMRTLIAQARLRRIHRETFLELTGDWEYRGFRLWEYEEEVRGYLSRVPGTLSPG